MMGGSKERRQGKEEKDESKQGEEMKETRFLDVAKETFPSD